MDNPLWGAPRIHGELLKLGFEVAQSSVAKYMVKRRGPPGQRWLTFRRNHAPDIAMDFFVVPTIGFDLLYAFVIVRIDRRELVWINVAFVHWRVPADKLTETAGPFWGRRVYETLRALGDIEGSNLVVERFLAEGRSERFASLAAEVVARKSDVILVNFNVLVRAFLAARRTIPSGRHTADPVAAGLLTDLAHPGANLTGVSISAGTEIYGKRLQILKEAMPNTAKVAVLLSGSWTNADGMSVYRAAAKQLGIELIAKELPEVNDTQLGRTYAEMADQHFDAVIVDESGSFLAQRALIVKLAKENRLPVMYPYRDYVELGGLMAYAPDFGELAQRLANDVHQILNGTKAGDIPFYLPTNSS